LESLDQLPLLESPQNSGNAFDALAMGIEEGISVPQILEEVLDDSVAQLGLSLDSVDPVPPLSLNGPLQ
jgi:hypothetical protein